MEKILTSVLSEKPKETWEKPDYTTEEQTYINGLQKRLESAKVLRDQPFPEFDDMTYVQYWQKNEDLANVKIKPKVNKSDVQFQMGTLRTKLFSFLSSLTGLNLDGEISAFDEKDVIINNLGSSLGDVVDKANELDQDEEKKELRFFELLKQGSIFVEEIWEDQWITEKGPIDNYKGQFRGFKITKKEVKKDGKAVRNIIPGISVYLGDLTKYFISDQPYIFTVQTQPYDEVKKIYKNFDMWKYVSRSLSQFSGDSDNSMTQNAWRLNDTQQDMVEVIKYQDKPNQEYQIILNGIPMLPIGFPFPWGYAEYNVTQQNFKPIRHNFAYGKSFIFENKNPIQVLDEMMKLGLLKTQKSFLPPYLNVSGRMISSKVLMPGTISMGITPGTLVPISPNEVQGVTTSEFSMIQELTKVIDSQTSSQTFSGGKEQGSPTATQIIEIQRQARIMLGVTILAASLLEKKLTILRLMNVLKNWFDPIDEVVDKARKELKNRYRITSRLRNIDGAGNGIRLTIPTEKLPTSDQLKMNEDAMSKDVGMPVRIIALNPKELAGAKITWLVNVNPREKRSSELSKLMFRSMVEDANALGLQLDNAWKQERFAQTWGEDSSKMYSKATPPGTPVTPAAPGGQGNAPTIKKPVVQMNPQGEAPAQGII